jgi:hypothetical protein
VNGEYQASLGGIARACLKKKKKEGGLQDRTHPLLPGLLQQLVFPTYFLIPCHLLPTAR